MSASPGRGRLAAIPPVAFGLAFAGIGLLCLIARDFALNWQPYPEGLPSREAWAMASGAVGLVGGLLTVARPTRRLGGLILAVFVGLWALALHAPLVGAKPAVIAGWNGLAESTALALGALVISREARPGLADPLVALALRLFGACCVIFGLAHFAYAEFTSQMVPAWLPMRLQLAYLTGAVHALTGLAMLAGFRPRLAAAVEGLMMLSFVVLVHLPRVAAKPADRMELTMLCIAVALASSAWALATSRRP
jgi:uncharacterized membrane protein